MNDDDERTHLETLLDIHRRSVRALEQQEAQFLGSPPVHILHQLEAGRRQIRAIEEQLGRRPPADATRVDFWTYAGGDPGGQGCERLDWSASFGERLPSPDEWSAQLLPQLRALLERCGRTSSRVIALYPQAHISAAIAFGQTFPTTGAYVLWANQKGEWWSTRARPGEMVPLQEAEEVIDAAQPDTSVEVSVTRDVGADVAEAIARLKLPIGRRVRLALPSQRVRDAAHAKAIAEQVRAAIVRVRQRDRGQPIHLFASAPVALAALIGAHLNACGLIQCYEHRKPQPGYAPAALLRC